MEAMARTASSLSGSASKTGNPELDPDEERRRDKGGSEEEGVKDMENNTGMEG
jgi:hypothetical protein